MKSRLQIYNAGYKSQGQSTSEYTSMIHSIYQSFPEEFWLNEIDNLIK